MRHKIYTDASVIKWNPGPGGIAWIVNGEEHKLPILWGYVSNNYAELFAIECGIRAVSDNSEIDLYTDSKVCVKWLTKQWKCHKGNLRYFLESLWIYTIEHNVKVYIHWVKGHNKNQLNNRADQLANEMAKLAYANLGNPDDNELIPLAIWLSDIS